MAFFVLLAMQRKNQCHCAEPTLLGRQEHWVERKPKDGQGKDRSVDRLLGQHKHRFPNPHACLSYLSAFFVFLVHCCWGCLCL